MFFCLFYLFLSSLLLAMFFPREFILHMILYFLGVFWLLFPFVMFIFLYILFCYYIVCFVSCCPLLFLPDVLDVCCWRCDLLLSTILVLRVQAYRSGHLGSVAFATHKERAILKLSNMVFGTT